MKEVTIKLYEFSELSEEVKKSLAKKDRQKPYGYCALNKEANDCDFRETLEAFCNQMGIKCSIDQYDNARWHFLEDNDIQRDYKGKLLLRWLNNHWNALFTPKMYFSKFSTIDGRYTCKERKSKIFFVELNCPLTGVFCDYDILNPLANWLKKPDWDITLGELIDKCFSDFIEAWNKANEGEEEDERIIESIEINSDGRFFLEDGTEFNV